MSPQRLTHYRENWYLDAYCHLREDLRSFGLDAIRGAALGPKAARDMPEDEIVTALDGGHGIFAGKGVE